MTMNVFYTSQAGQAQPNAQDGKPSVNAAGQASGLGGFFDLFLNNALEALEQNKATQTAGAQKKQQGGADTQSQLYAEILATNDDVRENLELIKDANVSDVLALNAQEFDQALIDPENAIRTDLNGKAGLPHEDILDLMGVSQDPKTIPGLSAIEKFLSKIQTLMAQDSPKLTALNITPQQINEIQSQIQAIKNGEAENMDELNALMVGIVKILPPQAKANVIAVGQALGMSQKQIEVLQSVPNGKPFTANEITGRATPHSMSAPLGDGEPLVFFDSDGKTGQSFEKILKDFAKTGNPEFLNKIEPGAGQSTKAENGADTPPAHVLQGWPFGNSGTLFSPMEFSAFQYDEMGLPLNGGQNALNSISPLTSLVTQSQSAAHAHPATHMVATAMQKAAGTGESKNIRIQLDPPELGRVEIKMSFNKDKTMKAILTAERPETFMMLQRDAHVLERALQESGLDVSADDALSFELADDGDFNQDGSHDGNRNETAAGEEGDETQEIIETTMTWHVDPETGHMRYNILA